MRRKRSSFMLSPGAFMNLEDSSPSPEDRLASKLELASCAVSPVPHQGDDVNQTRDDPLLDEVAQSFGALALDAEAARRQQLSHGSGGMRGSSSTTGRVSVPPQEEHASGDDPHGSSFFSDGSYHDCEQPFEIRTIPECLNQDDLDRSSGDSPNHATAQVTVSICSAVSTSTGRVSVGSFCSTFETPTIIKRQARGPPRREHDWGVSTAASASTLQTLTKCLEDSLMVEPSVVAETCEPNIMHREMTMMQRVKMRESWDTHLPPPHLRYSNTRTSTGSLSFDDQIAPPCLGRKSGGKDAELRRKQSVAKARRVSLGLQARAVSLMRRPRLEQSLAPVSDLSPCSARSSMESQGTTVDSPFLNRTKDICIRDLNCKVLSYCFSFLPPQEVITVLPLVCKGWESPALHARASILSDLNYLSPGVQRTWEWMVSSLPCGIFLSDGAFKSVFKVSISPQSPSFLSFSIDLA